MLTARDAQRLQGVHPALVGAIEAVFEQMHAAGAPMFVVCGVRTAAEQAALYAQGRTTSGPIVTNKDGVTHKSDHQPQADHLGHAVDCAFVPTKDRHDAWDEAWPWAAFGAAAEAAAPGVQWGGRWKQPADLDHVQYVAPEEAA